MVMREGRLVFEGGQAELEAFKRSVCSEIRETAGAGRGLGVYLIAWHRQKEFTGRS